MPKSKKVPRSRLLFGKVEPYVNTPKLVRWRAGRSVVSAGDIGPAWRAVIDGEVVGSAYDSLGGATLAIERRLASLGKRSRAFGWEPGK